METGGTYRAIGNLIEMEETGDKMKILVINGPNINMLGIREPEIYGKETYEDLTLMIEKYCIENSLEVEIFQSNHEGCIIDKIQEAYGKFDGIVINPAAYTHTSIGILDALKTVNIPTIEVHISDISAREEYRKKSYISPICKGAIIGKGLKGYIDAINLLI